jgi:MinD-like ATPase involved in chromosome partitioning or flagellar assembly
MGTLRAVDSEPAARRGRAVAVSSNKGGVGKTTLAANLAIYARAFAEIPVLVLGLDDQNVLDRTFAPGDLDGAGVATVKHAFAERSLERAVRPGDYGVHFVPSAHETELLRARAEDPQGLARLLAGLAWPGLVVIDTKSDLGVLTRNALHAADRVLVPVPDRSALLEAEKCFAYLARCGLGARGRVVLTLVDARAREGDGGRLAERLRAEVERRGWPLYRTALSRSPRVELLNSGEGRPRSILHCAAGTRIHAELGELTREVLEDLGLLAARPPAPAPLRARPGPGRRGLKAALLHGFGSR